MIRQALSEAMTEIINAVYPQGEALGDKWQSDNFTVLFPSLKFSAPTFDSTDGYWEGVSTLSGEAIVRIHTDRQNPFDPTELMIALIEQPIIIEPDPQTVAVGEYAIQLFFKPQEIQDLLYEDRVIPQLRAIIEHCYILKRTSFNGELPPTYQ